MFSKSRRAGHVWPIFLAACIAVTLGSSGDGVSSRVLAQQSVTSATLSGHVMDTDGANIVGAQITIASLDTNQNRTASSDEEGRYRFSYLPVGSYRLTVEQAGFTTVQKQL